MRVITPFATVVTILAVARLTRLITTDTILDPPRTWLVRRLTSDRLKYLMLCDWCMSVWVAAVTAPAAWYWWHEPWFLIPAIGLAATYVAGFLAQFGGE